MFQSSLVVVLATLSAVLTYPLFETMSFKVGIEYEHSLPMSGAKDRFRHKNNCDPFFVTVTASARTGFVISYLEATAYVDEGGDVEFHLIRGQSGSRTMSFQLVSNRSDFLAYSYLAYGIREEQYKKLTNVITLPMPNYARTIRLDVLCFIMFIALNPFLTLF